MSKLSMYNSRLWVNWLHIILYTIIYIILGSWWVNLLFIILYTNRTFSFRMAAREMSWQSNSSMRCRLWHETKCSSVRSVINGQLSSSSTERLSAAQLPEVKWRIPSSVISSQCERVYRTEEEIWITFFIVTFMWQLTSFSRLGQPMAKWASVRSVIWLHSSRSIRSRYLQFRPSAWKPISVKLRHPDTSNVLSCWLCCESAISERSVSSAHLDTHNFCSRGQLAASCRIDASVMVCKTEHGYCNAHDMRLISYCNLPHSCVDLAPLNRDSIWPGTWWRCRLSVYNLYCWTCATWHNREPAPRYHSPRPDGTTIRLSPAGSKHKK